MGRDFLPNYKGKTSLRKNPLPLASSSQLQCRHLGAAIMCRCEGKDHTLRLVEMRDEGKEPGVLMTLGCGCSSLDIQQSALLAKRKHNPCWYMCLDPPLEA